MKSWTITLITLCGAVSSAYAQDVHGDCGSQFTPKNGMVHSPRRYNEKRYGKSCRWSIRVPPGKKIEFRFSTVNIYKNYHCSTRPDVDYLKITETVRGEVRDLACFCKPIGTFPVTVVSNGSTANLTFHVGSRDSEAEFYLTYKILNTENFSKSCGGEFFEPSGLIMSPNYPNGVKSPVSCAYKITQPPGTTIRLTLSILRMGISSPHCTNYLDIHDGDNITTPLISSICNIYNNLKPIYEFHSTANYMFINFATFGALGKFQGFHAVYDTVDYKCGGVTTALKGVVRSPGFGRKDYDNNLFCRWKIQAPVGHVIVLRWSFFELEGYKGQCSLSWPKKVPLNCTGDSVEVSETYGNGTKLMIGLYRGSCLPPSVVSYTSAVNIKFETDSLNTFAGFSLDYYIINPAKIFGR